MRMASMAAAFLALAAGACVSSGPARDRGEGQAASISSADYYLGAGDKLRITVFNEPELTGDYEVGPTGALAYPLIGDFKVEGMTMSQAGEKLSVALAPYVRRPNVSVEMAAYRPFFILGEVGNPGAYPYTADLTVMKAVAAAGGFGYRAERKRVFIKRASETAERSYPLTSSTPVLPGDTVRIGERLF